MNATASGASLPGTDTTAIERRRLVAPQESGSVPPEERGQLTVDDRVVEKVAGHAVTSITDAAAAPRRMLGMNIGEARPDDAPTVRARVQDDTATIQVAIAVRWPRSVQQTAAEVRERIRSEVADITGVRVNRVDVEVVSMTMPASERRVT
jgi:uncharacterized alkaline shock family protein YloU